MSTPRTRILDHRGAFYPDPTELIIFTRYNCDGKQISNPLPLKIDLDQVHELGGTYWIDNEYLQKTVGDQHSFFVNVAYMEIEFVNQSKIDLLARNTKARLREAQREYNIIQNYI